MKSKKIPIEKRATLLATNTLKEERKQLAAEKLRSYTKGAKLFNDFKPMDSKEDGSNTKNVIGDESLRQYSKGYNMLLWEEISSSLIADGCNFDLLLHVSREKDILSSRKFEEFVQLKLEVKLREFKICSLGSTPLMLDSYIADMCMQAWGRSSYARAMIDLRADVELKDNIMAAMPKITRNIGDGATKNLKQTSQTPKGILVGQKLGFKPKQVYQSLLKKYIANTCGKKMNKSESTKEVSKSNPFEVLTSSDNDVDLGTNGGISNSVDKGTINVSSSNTPIGEKIDKIERQICEGKLRFVDDDKNPLVLTGIVDSDSEVKVVFDETTNLRISISGKEGSDKGYGTNSLLEQWKDSYPDNDDYYPHNDDMYENHDMFENLQSICDDLDITVHGRKKK
ncbi:hypothetical protein Tco_0828077 [Tanacetum coccineum]